MKILLLILVSLIACMAHSQSVLPLRADIIKMYKQNGSAELYLLNATRDSLGLAVNITGGHVIFKRPYVLNDSAVVIGNDTLVIRGNSEGAVSVTALNAAIADALSDLPINFDAAYFDGDGSLLNPWTPRTDVLATHAYTQALIDSLGAIVDAISPSGVAGGKTTLINVGAGDTLSKYVNDSLFHIKSLIAGTNITFTVASNTITINGASGSAEINSHAITLATTGNNTVAVESMIDYVLVKPSSSLTAFKIGTLADDDFFLTAVPVVATGDFVVFNLGAYLSASTAIYFSGITSSTDIKIIFKPVHE